MLKPKEWYKYQAVDKGSWSVYNKNYHTVAVLQAGIEMNGRQGEDWGVLTL
jgi:hypothetical protein